MRTYYGEPQQTEELPIVTGVQTEDVVTEQHMIGKDEIREAAAILAKYKQGKANLESRIVEEERWWQLRHWEMIRGDQRGTRTIVDENGKEVQVPNGGPMPTSAWLFNAIINKHADAMDNYPEPIVLPREQSDEQSADVLSEVLPVILQHCDFEKTYSDNWWEKLKHGTAAYGVFWNPEMENGLGDVDVRAIDLLKLFWEPGVTDLQKSRNLFIVDLVDDDLLADAYPQLKGRHMGDTVDVKQYIYDESIDTSYKSVVVDWYYKVKNGSRTILHYCKFVGDEVLYASENDPVYRETGFYDHGEYPVVLDPLWPEKGTPCGFGYVSICKDPQLYIDKLEANVLENAMMTSKKRFFVSDSTNVNVAEFMDWNRPLVHVQGELSDMRLKEITTDPLPSYTLNVIQAKIEEMKDTAANRDVNSGGTTGQVTAAAAIAALQEAGNKISRDIIAASYRVHAEVSSLCVELIRQFYNEARSFRITAPNGMGAFEYVQLSNAMMGPQPTGVIGADGMELYREPVFDLEISAQKKNPFSRMEQNERAKELYAMGFFAPENAQASMVALDMMDFEGIEDVREKVNQGATLLNICQQQAQEIAQLQMLLQGMAGIQPDMAPEQGGGRNSQGQQKSAGKPLASASNGGVADAVMQANTPMTGYGQRLAARSKPNLNVGGNGATPV